MQTKTQVLVAARAPTALVAVVGLLLLLPPQFHDMLASFHDHPYAGVMFQVSLGGLAFLVWYWSRAALNAAVDMLDAEAKALTPQQAGRWWTGWPHVLFAAVGLIGFVLALKSEAMVQALLSLVWTAGGTFLLWKRRGQADGPGPVALPGNGWGRLVRCAPFGSQWFARSTILLGLAVFVLAGIDTFVMPDRLQLSDLMARAFPGPAAALACFALMLGPLTLLTVWAHRAAVTLPLGAWRPRLPVPWLVVGGLLLGASTDLPLYSVRLAEPGSMPPAKRAVLADAFASWVATCTRGTGTVRPVIVALSGGASRAGLWSSRLLRAIDRAAPGQDAGVFAISSVSGGSLGAADYVVERAASTPCHLAGWKGAHAAPLATVADDDRLVGRYSHDMLGPLLAGFLLDDSARALLALPMWPILEATGRWPVRGGDRASALERAWERAWADDGAPGGRIALTDMRSGFLDEFYDRKAGWAWRRGMPIWISNGTDVLGGERLVTVPVQPLHKRPGDGVDLQSSWPFEGAKDVLALLRGDVRMSTAVLNSARFPFLSPSGGLRPATPERNPAQPGYAAQTPHIVDGGYFENSGVTTAFELVTWLRNYAVPLLRQAHRPVPDMVVDPILVAVDADAETSVNGDDVPRCGSGPSRDPEMYELEGAAPELLAPFAALYDTRSGHGDYAIQKAREAMCNQMSENVPVLPGEVADRVPTVPSFFHFYLHATDQGLIPLNWALSKDTEHLIWTNLDRSADNRREFERLRLAMDPKRAAPSVTVASQGAH
jgi:hypothetical protein